MWDRESASLEEGGRELAMEPYCVGGVCMSDGGEHSSL